MCWRYWRGKGVGNAPGGGPEEGRYKESFPWTRGDRSRGDDNGWEEREVKWEKIAGGEKKFES